MASAGTAPATVNSAGTLAQTTAAQASALARVRISARWFYWIAGLSLINSAVVIFGGSFHFVVGLGVTSVVDAFAKLAGNAGIVLDLIINGFVAGLFCLFGSCASKAQKWAFLVGMILYALDGLLLLLAHDILSVGFHAYALYCIYRGLAATDAAAQA
jgi:hypothetical protein